MGAPSPAQQRETRSELAKLLARSRDVYVIHYACQSFSAAPLRTSPRIAAIAVRKLENGQTECFSIHREAELLRSHDLSYLERSMLDKFFQYLAQHRGAEFIHWNMRDLTFGFQAIEHRYESLGGKPLRVDEHRRHDLALSMLRMYGENYAEHPILETLARKNNLSVAGLLHGQSEAQAFEQGQYLAVAQSVQGKVKLIAEIVDRAKTGSLKTDADWWTANKFKVREIYEMCFDNPLKALVGTTLAAFLAFAKYFA